MKIVDYLALLDDAEQAAADAFTLLATRHAGDADIRDTAVRLAEWSLEKRLALKTAIETYGRSHIRDTKRIDGELFRPRPGGFGMLRDLHDASLLIHHVHLCWTAVHQAAQALVDEPLTALCKREIVRTDRQARWLRTCIKVAAPQALTIVPDKSSELRATLQSMKPRLVLAGAISSAAALAIGAVVMFVKRVGA